MANPPFDPYGHPVPINPGAKRVTDESGATYPIRSNLALTGLTVTDNPMADTTELEAAAPSTSGQWVLVEEGSIASGTFTSASWAAETYKEIEIVYEFEEAPNVILTFPGITGYKSETMSNATPFADASNIYIIAGAGTAQNATGIVRCEIEKTGRTRKVIANSMLYGTVTGTTVIHTTRGVCTNTADDITSVTLTGSGGSAASSVGYFRIYGR